MGYRLYPEPNYDRHVTTVEEPTTPRPNYTCVNMCRRMENAESKLAVPQHIVLMAGQGYVPDSVIGPPLCWYLPRSIDRPAEHWVLHVTVAPSLAEHSFAQMALAHPVLVYTTRLSCVFAVSAGGSCSCRLVAD